MPIFDPYSAFKSSPVATTTTTAAPPTAPTTTPTPPPVNTYVADTRIAKDMIAGDMGAGMDWANTVLPDGTLGRLNDPRQAEINELLAKLKERTGGMNSQEMLAAREQGLAGMDQQLSQNLMRTNRLAGNAGVRGGAAAGLGAQAIRQNSADRAGLERQMILDNIAQKNSAFAAYGSALTGQQGTELGIQQYNAGAGDRETVGRLDLATQYGGMIDSARAGIAADRTAAESTQIAKDFLKTSQNPTAQDPLKIPDSPFKTQFMKQIEGRLSRDGKRLSAEDALEDPVVQFQLKHKINIMKGDQIPDSLKTEYSKALEESSKLGFGGTASSGTNEIPPAAGTPANEARPTVICTEALAQGLVSEKTYSEARGAEPVLGYTTLRNYQAWGKPVVESMKRHNRLAKVVSWFLAETVAAIHGNPHTLRGDIGYAVFHSLNTLVKWKRSYTSVPFTVKSELA